ncbi:MAG TPA: hypothetical protein PKO06_13470, partial [Candidatus Ozemobacteraceae bacterium]|nr:hypothetical protein [Candidatus Ozemobacteraceae bacterium]
DLLRKAELLRKHRTPAEAGIVTPGASPAKQKQEIDDFLAKARAHMQESLAVGKQASDRLTAGRKADLHQARQNGDANKAENLRITEALINTTNEAGIRVLSARDPGLMASVVPEAPKRSEASKPDLEPTTIGWGWFSERLLQKPDQSRVTLSPELQKTADRFQKIVDALEKSGLAGAKPGTREYRHLENLKNAAKAGASDPIAGLRQTRMISGFSSGQVLEELEKRVGVVK